MALEAPPASVHSESGGSCLSEPVVPWPKHISFIFPEESRFHSIFLYRESSGVIAWSQKVESLSGGSRGQSVSGATDTVSQFDRLSHPWHAVPGAESKKAGAPCGEALVAAVFIRREKPGTTSAWPENVVP